MDPANTTAAALDNLHFYMGSMASFDSQSLQNKENQNTQNETGDDSYDETVDNRDGLTPLNGNTKLRTPQRERSAQAYLSPVRLVELPKISKRSFFQHADIKDLPPLPNTPSPPRSKKWGSSPRKVWSPKRTPKRVEGANKDTYEDYNHYFDTYRNAQQQQQPRYHAQQQQQQPRYQSARAPPHYQTRFKNLSSNWKPSAWYNGSGMSDGQIPSNYTSNSASYSQSSNSSYGDGAYSRFNRAPRFQSSDSLSSGSARPQQLPRGMVTCKYWSKGIVCKHGDHCAYSHSTKCDDVRKRVTNYKTKPCVDPGRGLRCEYSDRCNFAHPGEALRRPMPIEYFDKQYFRLLLRDCPTNRYPFGIFV